MVFSYGGNTLRVYLYAKKQANKEEKMINFEEELKHFQPSSEIEDAESEIYEHDITDMTDIMQQMMMELKRK